MKKKLKKNGRNALCYCGSGEKYKRCCLNLNPATHIMPESNEMIARQKSIKRLENRIMKEMGNSTRIFQSTENNDVKMSEIIIDLADFLLERCESSEKKQRAAINITCLAWNMAVVGTEKAQKFLDNYFENEKDAIHVKDTIDITNAIIQKKNECYSNINRIIMGYEMITIKNRLHLSVVSMEQEENTPHLEKNASEALESIV